MPTFHTDKSLDTAAPTSFGAPAASNRTANAEQAISPAENVKEESVIRNASIGISTSVTFTPSLAFDCIVTLEVISTYLAGASISPRGVL